MDKTNSSFSIAVYRLLVLVVVILAAVVSVNFYGYLAEIKQGGKLTQTIASRRRENTVKPSTSPHANGVQLVGRADSADASAQKKADAFEMDDKLLRSSIWNSVRARQTRRGIMRDYGYILDGLPNLAPDIQRQIKQLLVERQWLLSDTLTALAKQGVPHDSELHWKAMYDATAAVDTKMASLCGDYGAKFSELLQLSGAMHLVNNYIIPDLLNAGESISYDQKVSLAKAMSEVHYSIADPMFRSRIKEPINPTTGYLPVFSDLLGKAETFLTPKQLAAVARHQYLWPALRITSDDNTEK
jgi:hypothetical protein